MLDHHRQPHALELAGGCRAESRHVIVGHHSVVRVAGHLVARVRVDGDVPFRQPRLHLIDFRLLCGANRIGEIGELGRDLPARDHVGHLQGLLVVRDHALHEGNVGLVVRRAVGRLARLALRRRGIPARTAGRDDNEEQQ